MRGLSPKLTVPLLVLFFSLALTESFVFAKSHAHESARFVVICPSQERADLSYWAEMCELTLDRLTPRFPPPEKREEKIRAIFAPSLEEFARLTGMDGRKIQALARPRKQVLFLNGASLTGLDDYSRYQTVGHEMVHLLLGRIAMQTDQFVPAWLHEGLAQSLTATGSLQGSMKLAYATAMNRRIPMNRLASTFPYGSPQSELAYAQSLAFTKFIAEKRLGFDSPRSFFEALLFREAFARRTLRDLSNPTVVEMLEMHWHGHWGNLLHFFLIIGSSSLVWMLIILLVVWAFWKKRQRSRQVIAGWEPWEREGEDPPEEELYPENFEDIEREE